MVGVGVWMRGKNMIENKAVSFSVLHMILMDKFYLTLPLRTNSDLLITYVFLISTWNLFDSPLPPRHMNGIEMSVGSPQEYNASAA